MKVEYNEETSVRKSLSFEIEADVVGQEIEARSRDYAKKVKLPGFRQGKIPSDVIKKRFKAQVLEDVAEKLINKVVFEEIEGRGLKPLANPQVMDLKIDEGQPLTFRAVFETLPIVELPEYHGLRAKSRTPNLTDDAVTKEIDELRENAARYDAIEDRPVQSGDHLVADVAWRPSGGGKTRRNENAMIEVGAAETNKEINAALIGMTPGETKHVHVVYEPQEGAEGAKPEAFDYTITVKALKKKTVPAADDDFAKDLGDFGSLAELREDVRRRLLQAETRKLDRELKSALVDDLVARSSMEVPEALVDRHMSARAENAARGLAMQGIDPRKIGVDWKQYREGQREESVKAAKADILLNEIAHREGIDATEAEIDAEIDRFAARFKKSKEAMRAQMEKEGELSALRARLREEKTLDLLKSNAKVELEG